MNFISRIIKSINAMRERLKIERHEAMYGPHFNEECALKAVSKMENEDGSRGEHWSLEETTSIANQYGINLKGEKYNKYDWYVALNMIRSDYYRAVVTMTSSDHIKYFVELAKAWLNDKDIEEGKMWYYYCYIMCDKLRKEAKTMLMLEDDEDEEREYRYARGGRGRGRGRGGRMTRYGYDYDEDDEYLDREREEERMHRYEPMLNKKLRATVKGSPTKTNSIMLFSQLKIGDHVHVLEVLGTFKKTTVYSLGSITQVSNPYDEALPQGQFPIPGQNRRKLVDVFISCNGESKKLSVPAERSIINDTSIGLTVATNKEEIANMVRQNYNEFKAKKEAASKYDEEMDKCKDILDQLEAQVEDPIVTNTIDNSKEINDLKNDVADIRKMIEDTKKMFMGGFPKPPMPPMPNVPAPMK